MQITIPGGKQFRVPWGFIAGFGAAAVVGLIAALLMTLVFGGSSAGSAIGASEAGNSAPASASARLNSQQGDIGATEKVAKDPAQATSQKAPATAREVTSGKYKLSQITSSSPNMLVALFGAAREGRNPREALQYTDVDALAVKKTRRFYPFGSFYPFTRLEELTRSSDDKSFLVIGSLRDPTNNKFLDPKDALPDVSYLVSTLFADDFGDGNLYDVQEMVFLLYKTSSGEWRIRDFSFREFVSGNAWDGDALRRQLKKANNEPFNISE